jgi:tRNA (guanosine-2'-O-)-methyltransferase
MTRTRDLRVQRVNAVVAIVTTALACSAPYERPTVHEKPPAKTVLLDEGHQLRLAEACIFRGIETCFDAIDDNCNGLVDEGCGLPNGPLQFVIAWEPPEADVDLDVFDPLGEPVLVGRSTSLGLTKDRDCPKEPNECGGQNVEVVYVGGDEVPPGRYRVTLRLRPKNAGENDVNVRFGGHIGNESVSGVFQLSWTTREARFELIRAELEGKAARAIEKTP